MVRSTRIAYVAYLVLLFTILITLVQLDHLALFLGSEVNLPVVNKPVSQLGFFVFAPLLIVLVHAGLMFRIFSMRRLMAACCYDSDGKLRPLAVRRRVKNILPSFDIALAFSSVPLGRSERLLRVIVAGCTVVVFPSALLLYFIAMNIVRGGRAESHFWILSLLSVLTALNAWGLLVGPASRVKVSAHVKGIALIYSSVAILIVLFCLLVFKPTRPYSEWNPFERAFFSTPLRSHDFRQSTDVASMVSIDDFVQKHYFGIATSRSLFVGYTGRSTVLPVASEGGDDRFYFGENAQLRQRQAANTSGKAFPRIFARRFHYPFIYKVSSAGLKMDIVSFVGGGLVEWNLIASRLNNVLFHDSYFYDVDLSYALLRLVEIDGSWIYGLHCEGTEMSHLVLSFSLVQLAECDGATIDQSVIVGLRRWLSDGLRLSSTKFRNSYVAGNEFLIGKFRDVSLEGTSFVLNDVTRHTEEGDEELRSALSKGIYNAYNHDLDAVPSDFAFQFQLFRYVKCRELRHSEASCLASIERFLPKKTEVDSDQWPSGGSFSREAFYQAGLVPGMEVQALGGTISNTPVACQLALFAEELSDVERIVLCPLRYGTLEAKDRRELLSTNSDIGAMPVRLDSIVEGSSVLELCEEEGFLDAIDRFMDVNSPSARGLAPCSFFERHARVSLLVEVTTD